eukprot:jgi/Tetstr1/441228/TSEL_029484.t1
MAGSTKMEPLRDLVEDGTDLPASSPASSAELFKAITAALALCTTVALRINKRGKKLHVEHDYGAEVAKEFDAVDPLGEKGSADNKELKKAIEKRKNDQHRLCGKVRVAKMPRAVVCVYGLLRRYHAVMIRWATPTVPVFPGFSGTVLRHKGELGMVPSSSPIEYPTFRRYLGRCFSSPLLAPAMTEAAFLTRFGPQSSRTGGASAAANADIAFATWGQRGGWKSTSAQLRYMGLDEEHNLSVSRAILSLAEEDELDDSDAR